MDEARTIAVGIFSCFAIIYVYVIIKDIVKADQKRVEKINRNSNTGVMVGLVVVFIIWLYVYTISKEEKLKNRKNELISYLNSYIKSYYTNNRGLQNKNFSSIGVGYDVDDNGNYVVIDKCYASGFTAYDHKYFVRHELVKELRSICNAHRDNNFLKMVICIFNISFIIRMAHI